MAAVPTWKGPTASLVEADYSPAYEFGSVSTKTRTFFGLHSLCVSSAPARGAVGTGDDAGYIVGKSTVAKNKGNIGTLVITYEASASSGLPLPPDEAYTEPWDINPRVQKHPYCASLTAAELFWLDAAVNAATEEAQDQAAVWIALNGSAKASWLLDLLWRGTESYIQSGAKYYWSSYSYTAPTTTNGTYIQTPTGWFASNLPSGMSWIRLADGLAWTGALYKLTRTWLGGPSGYWDTHLYA